MYLLEYLAREYNVGKKVGTFSIDKYVETYWLQQYEGRLRNLYVLLCYILLCASMWKKFCDLWIWMIIFITILLLQRIAKIFCTSLTFAVCLSVFLLNISSLLCTFVWLSHCLFICLSAIVCVGTNSRASKSWVDSMVKQVLSNLSRGTPLSQAGGQSNGMVSTSTWSYLV